MTAIHSFAMTCLTVVIACAPSGDGGARAADAAGGDSASATPSIAQLGAEVILACGMADSLLKALAGSSRKVDAAYDFGAKFGSEPRAGCESSFSGIARRGPAISDSVLSFWQREGWRIAPRYQADGIGENLTGMYRGSALCLINSHLDMNDEGDQGPVLRSDKIDVAISCTKLLATDTLPEPSSE